MKHSFWLLLMFGVFGFGAIYYQTSNVELQVAFSTSVAAVDGTVTLCEGETLTFTDTSVNVPEGALYQWTFEGGTPNQSDQEGPVEVLYNTTGSYTAMLQINEVSVSLLVEVVPNEQIQPQLTAPDWGFQTYAGLDYLTFCGNVTATGGFLANFAFEASLVGNGTNYLHTIATDSGEWSVQFLEDDISDADDLNFEFFLAPGFHQVNYTIAFGACSYTQVYNLYIGANPTATITNAGVPILCENTETSYSIAYGAQNGPGTVYEISVGNEVVAVFNHPPPAEFTYTFEDVSCGEQQIVVNGITYNNAYEMSITAINACGQSTNTIVPIYIESGPEADLSLDVVNEDQIIVCEGSLVMATDITIPGNNVSNLGLCNDGYNHFWEIVAPDGSILSSTPSGVLNPNPFVNVTGNMGFVPVYPILDNVSGVSWSGAATSNIVMEFITPGTYFVNIYAGSNGQSNQCGVTMQSKTICVTPAVEANFELDLTEACGPVTVNTTNLSSEAGCGTANIYNWSVAYQNPQGCTLVNNPDWVFLDNTNAQSFEPQFELITPGIYNISLNLSLDDNVPGALCQESVFSQTVIVKGPPQFTLPQPLDICQNTDFTFDLELYNCYSNNDTVVFEWDFNNNSAIVADNTNVLNPTITVNQPGTYPYSITVTNECGTTALSDVIEVFEEVTVTATGVQESCQGEPIVLLGNITGGTLQGTWEASVPGGAFVPDNQTLNTSYVPPLNYTGNIEFTLQSADPVGPCNAVNASFTVEIFESALVDVGPDLSTCVNDSVSLTATLGGAAQSGVWTDTVGGAFDNAGNVQTNYVPPPDFTGSVVLTFTSNNPTGPCAEAEDSVVLEVIDNGTMQGMANIDACDNSVVVVPDFMSANANTLFTWTNSHSEIGLPPSGFGNIGSFTALNDTAQPITATITVTPYLENSAIQCLGTPQTFDITVQPTPEVVFSETFQTLCTGGTSLPVELSSQTANAQISWSILNVPAGLNGVTQTTGTTQIPSFTLINSTQTPLQLDVTVAVVTQAPAQCAPVESVYSITVLPDVSINTQPLALQTLCIGGTPQPLGIGFSSIYANAQVNWFVNSQPNTSGGVLVGTGTSVDLPMATAAGTSYYYATLQVPDNGCDATVSDIAVVEVLEDPVVTLQSADQMVCQNTSQINNIVVSASGGTGNFEYRFFVSPTNDYSNAASVTNWQQDNTFTPPTNTTGTFYYFAEVRYTIDTDGSLDCATFSAIQRIEVLANPDIDEQPLPYQLLCKDQAAELLQVSVNTGIGTPQYQWYQNTGNNNTGGTPIANANNSTFMPLTDTAGIFYYYCVVTVDSSCEPAVSNVAVVEVGEVPEITNQTLTVCSDESFAFSVTDVINNTVPAGTAYTYNFNPNANVTGATSNGVLQTTVAQTLTNLTNVVQQIVYTVTPVAGTAGSCVGEAFNLTVSVEPEPVLQDQFATICSGESLQHDLINNAATGDIIPAGTTFSWVAVDNPDIIGETNGTGTEVSQLLTNTTLAPQQLVLQITPTTPAGCVGAPFNLIVTVDSAQINISNKSIEVCSDTAFNFSPQSGTGGDLFPANTTFTWQVQPNALITGWFDQNTPQSEIAQTLSLSGNTPETIIYNVTPNSGNCTGPVFQLAVVVYPLPQITDVDFNDASVCTDNSFLENSVLSDMSGAQINWTLTNNNVPPTVVGYPLQGIGNLPAFTAFNTGNQAYTLVYSVQATVNNCTGPEVLLNYTVHPNPAVQTNIQDQLICSGETSQEVLLSSPTDNAQLNWTVVNVPANLQGVSSTNGTGNIPPFTLSNNGTEPVTLEVSIQAVTNNNVVCTGASQSHFITVNPVPQLNPIDGIVVCSSQLIGDISITSPNNPQPSVTYQWETVNAPAALINYIPSGTTAVIPQQTIINTTNVTQLLTYAVQPFFDGCAGAVQTFDIEVQPAPQIADIEVEVCSEAAVDLPLTFFSTQGNVVPEDTGFTWTFTPNPEILGATESVEPQTSFVQTLTNLSDVPQQLQYILQPVNTENNCSGLPFVLTVTVQPKPFINSYTLSVCSGSLLDATPAAAGNLIPQGTLYTYTVVNNVNVTGANNQTTPVSQIDLNLVNNTNTLQTLNYTVTPISGNCSGDSFELTVQLEPTPVINSFTAQPVCSGDVFNLSQPDDFEGAAIFPDGTSFTYTIQNNPNVTGATGQSTPQSSISQTLINLTNTIQEVIYTVTPQYEGCFGLPFDITVPVVPKPAINNFNEVLVCSNETLQLTPQNNIDGIVPDNTLYTWQVVSPNALISGWNNEPNPQPDISQTLVNLTDTAQTINYEVTPVFNNCLGASFTLTVVVAPQPLINDVTADICSNNAFELIPQTGVIPDAAAIVPNGTLYNWDAPAVSSDISGVSVGNNAIAFDTGNLINTSNQPQLVTYVVTPVFTYTSGNLSVTCQGAPFNVSITVGPVPNIQANVINASCVYDDNLCDGSIELTVTGNQPFSYNWTSVTDPSYSFTDASQPNQYQLCPGIYRLTLTDGAGCEHIEEYEILPPTPVNFNLISLLDVSCNVNNNLCDGAIELSLEGGITPYSQIQWFTESVPNSNQFNVLVQANVTSLQELCEGRYVLRVTDAQNCQFTSPVYTVVNLNTTLEITRVLSNYSGFNVSCNGANNGFIHVTVAGNIGNLNYNLSPGNVTDSNPATPNVLEFDNLTAGTYTLTVADSNCPSGVTLNYVLTAPEVLSASAILISDPISCNGDAETYQINATGGVAPYQGTGVYNFSAGTHNVTVTDANGCETTVGIVVDEPAPLQVNAVILNGILCAGDTATVAVEATGGTAPYTGTGVFSLQAGTFNYTVTDANGCADTGSIEIVEPQPINFNIVSVNQPDCDDNWNFSNGSICISVTGDNNPVPVGNNWVSLGGGFWCLENLTAGDYNIAVTNDNNCAAVTIDTVTLDAPPPLMATINTQIDSDCDNNTVRQINTLNISGGLPPYQVTWSNGSACDSPSDLCMTTTVNGTYFVDIHDQYSLQNNCAPYTLQLEVNLPVPGSGSFDYSVDANLGCDLIAVGTPVSFNQNLSGDVITVSWDFGDGSPPVVNVDHPVYVYNTEGTYTVTLSTTDALGCTRTFSDVVEVGAGYELILPTAFTPNGDGLNDTIRPLGLCLSSLSMQIYDSWGALLYSETNQGNWLEGWNGRLKDTNIAENGNYVMIVNAVTQTGLTIKRQITVTLIN
jgi:large repetitive protein